MLWTELGGGGGVVKEEEPATGDNRDGVPPGTYRSRAGKG